MRKRLLSAVTILTRRRGVEPAALTAAAATFPLESVVPMRRMWFQVRRGGAALQRWFRVNTFAPRWLGAQGRHPVVGYVVALAAALVALSVSGLLIHANPQFAYVSALSFLAITLVAIGWGAGPSVVSTVAAALLSNVLLLPYRAGMPISLGNEFEATVIFLAVGIAISLLASKLEAERRRAEDAAQSLGLAKALQENLVLETHRALDVLLAMAETLVDADEPPDGRQTTPAQRLADLAAQLIHTPHLALFALESADAQPRLLALSEPGDEGAGWGERVTRAVTLALPGIIDPLLRDQTAYVPLAERDLMLLPMVIPAKLIGFVAIQERHGDQLAGVALDLARAARLMGLVLQRDQLLRQREEARATALALFQVTRRMDSFVSLASHELRTPLATIKGNIQLVNRRMQALAGAPLPDDVRERIAPIAMLLERTDRQVKRINALIGDLLDASRIEAGRFVLRRAPCDMVTLITEIVQEQRLLWPDRAIRFTPAAPSLPLVADADRVTQAINNYLSNALKYSDAAEPVDLIAARETTPDGRAWVRVAVRDNGSGLTLDEQRHIWERFAIIDGAEARDAGSVGLGMGLFICRTVVERHHGRFGVESLPQMGSTFWFALPADEAPDDRAD